MFGNHSPGRKKFQSWLTPGWLLLAAAVATAEEEKPPAAEAPAETAEKPPEKPAPEKAEAGKEEPDITLDNLSNKFRITNDYVHQWKRLPQIEGEHVKGGYWKYNPTGEEVVVAVFMASWCKPCQKLLPAIRDLDRRYSGLHTRFIYIFTHDTRKDAEKFADHFGLTNRSILANHVILDTYHQPVLPTLFISDRHGFLTERYLKATAGDLTALDQYLNGQNQL